MKVQIKEKLVNSKTEFLDFLKNYNVMDLAIGVVIGTAVKDLVNSLANDLVMPIIGIFTPDGSWRDIVLTVGASDFKVGNFLGSLVNFLIIALIVFVVIQKILKLPIGSKK